MVAVKFQATRFTMEQTIGQLQFEWRFLTAFGTRLAGMVGGHLMEMFAITFCDPMAPIKEHSPRGIRNRLGKVTVLYHIARFEFLGNHRIKTFVMEKVIDGFREKVKTLAGNNIGLFCQRIFRLIPAFALIRFAPKIAVKLDKFAFSTSIKAGVGFFLAFRSRQKIVCAYVHTTSGLRDTGERIRHFTNDKAIPTARRPFQCDLFRVSDKWTVLADFHFTEFRHFQSVMPSACFTNRVLADTFTRFECMLSQVPCQRANRGFIPRIPFFSAPSLHRRWKCSCAALTRLIVATCMSCGWLE